MFLARLASRGPSIAFPRLWRCFRTSDIRLKVGSPRKTSELPNILGGNKFLLPKRLLIYHAGVRRIVFVGLLKLSTVMIFGFISLLAAGAHKHGAHWYTEGEPRVIAAVILGSVPMFFVGYFSKSFVNQIHLRIPDYTRHSQEMLLRYSKTLPNDAQLEITTLNLVGKPRVSITKAGDLKRVGEKPGYIDLLRDTERVEKERSWWMIKPIRHFRVHGNSQKLPMDRVWGNVLGRIGS